jgi:hypothetical protein
MEEEEKEIEPYDYDYWEEYFKEMQIRQAEAM